MSYLLYVLASAIGGLLVGLIGTGMSLVVLPSLVLIFAGLLDGYDTLRLAAGTTMAAMAAGAIAGALAQYRAGHLDFRLFRWMLTPYIAGALVGPWVSRLLPTRFLSIYVAVIIAVVALKMLTANRGAPLTQRNYHAHRSEITVVLAGIALLSSIAGIASGIFAIPYLIARFSLPVRTIIGTSTAAAAVYSTVGAIGYVSAGWSAPNLPDNALGFVYLPAFLIMAVMASLCTPLGVRLASHINERKLRRLFAVFLLVAATAIILS
ncbi:MAG TPA: sulfite exporter TauE/SafE family protein [Burkholderiales bacterium]|nr:sulfite exporter TauE/SafE family protein [Burkholderiales bacterium]